MLPFPVKSQFTTDLVFLLQCSQSHSGNPMADYKPHSLRKAVRQSLPVDLTKPYDLAWVKGKHILITGGASGFGAEFARTWASAGASIIAADINAEKGTEVVAKIRKSTGNEQVHFVQCDVTDWQAQVRMFKEAVRLSPHGGIDCVVANAGVAGIEPLHEPSDYSVDEPRKPNFKTIDVNVTGVLYTTQLALYWLQRNPGSKPCALETDPSKQTRDRHILLVGSMASLGPIVGVPLYGVSKHAVLGLFRCLRGSSFMDGVRVNIIFPYFIETPINPAPSRLLLAGSGMGKIEDVVDAASRLVADSSILGRGLVAAPKVKVKQQEDGEWTVLPDSADGEEKAIWEAYADDYEDGVLFSRRMIAVLNGVTALKGWIGWATDVYKAIKYGIWG